MNEAKVSSSAFTSSCVTSVGLVASGVPAIRRFSSSRSFTRCSSQ